MSGKAKDEKNINDAIKYALFVMVAILSQILTFEFLRGFIELALAIASFLAYQRSRSEMIQNVTLIAFIILLLMGLYDISSTFGWI